MSNSPLRVLTLANLYQPSVLRKLCGERKTDGEGEKWGTEGRQQGLRGGLGEGPDGHLWELTSSSTACSAPVPFHF